MRNTFEMPPQQDEMQVSIKRIKAMNGYYSEYVAMRFTSQKYLPITHLETLNSGIFSLTNFGKKKAPCRSAGGFLFTKVSHGLQSQLHRPRLGFFRWRRSIRWCGLQPVFRNRLRNAVIHSNVIFRRSIRFSLQKGAGPVLKQLRRDYRQRPFSAL